MSLRSTRVTHDHCTHRPEDRIDLAQADPYYQQCVDRIFGRVDARFQFTLPLNTAKTLISLILSIPPKPPYTSIVIEPSRGYARVEWRELWAAREWLYFLAWRDLKTRYAQTAIGVGWALMQPLLSTLILTRVFSYLAKVPSDGLPYPIFAFAAILPWSLFARSLERSTLSVVTEGGLIKKLYFLRLIIPSTATFIIRLILLSDC